MRLVVNLKLLPTPEQAGALRDTLERANAAVNRPHFSPAPGGVG